MKTRKSQLTSQREIIKEAGFYDGRFKNKVVPNKKKKAQKEWARKNNGDVAQR